MACLLSGIGAFLGFFLQLIIIAVIASVVVSWVGDPYNQVVQTINRIVEPIYKPFRPLTSKIPGPMDFTPLLVFGAVYFLQYSVVLYLKSFGTQCAGGM